ncbi:MAG: (2Fe-2S)-binding protein [bacterium]|nr:(2Fe-2S)-binding protein [bacterium]
MPTISINEREVAALDGETVLEACERHGVRIPTLCHLKHLTPTGACRLCAVEVEGQRALVPSCAFPVAEGMKVRTHSARAVEARRVIVELLLANHPDDCLYCVRNTDCQLRGLAAELGVQGRRFFGKSLAYKMDASSPAIVRDPAKCILCGKCVRVCEEVEGVGCIDFIGRGSATTVGPALDQGLNVSSCINCGQCIMVCPTGALSEHSNLPPVLAALGDPRLTVVVQHAPAVALTLGEEFGLKPGADVAGLLNAALRRLGFARVYETAFTADLTVMEEASELVQRIRGGGTLPMMTSCSPGWIKYVEQFHPEFIPNLSTCKSPQMMLGALVKSPLSAAAGLDPEKVFSVSVMPCVAKKFEAARPELHTEGVPDVDAVLTTRELVTLLRQRGLDLARLEPEPADDPFGARSTAGRLFAGSGGVMESALRTAHWLLTGRDLAELRVQAVRSGEGVRECRVKIDGLEIGAAVVSGLKQAKDLLAQLSAGRSDLHFIEVMTCPGGCLNGGGQVRAVTPDAVRARQQALYALDREGGLRTAHANESIRRLYDEYLGAPLGELSHRYLHTHYAPREVVR